MCWACLGVATTLLLSFHTSEPATTTRAENSSTVSTNLTPDLILVKMDGEPSNILIAAMKLIEERNHEQDNRASDGTTGRDKENLVIVNRKETKGAELAEPIKNKEIGKVKPAERQISSRLGHSKIKRRNQIRNRVRRKRKGQKQADKKETPGTGKVGDIGSDIAKVEAERPRLRVSRNRHLRTRRKIKMNRKDNTLKTGNQEETINSFATPNYAKQPINPEEIPVEPSTTMSKLPTNLPSEDTTNLPREDITSLPENTGAENVVNREQFEESIISFDQDRQR